MTLALSKKCTVCKEDKTLDCYYVDKRGKYGRYARCIPCFLAKNSESASTVVAKQNRSKRLASQRAQINERQRKYYREHPWLRDYYNSRKRSPEYMAAANHRRRMRLEEAKSKGNFTSDEWLKLCQLFDNKCCCCGVSGKMTVDHVIPISRGGSNSIDNIQPLCGRCNSSKGVGETDYRVGST